MKKINYSEQLMLIELFSSSNRRLQSFTLLKRLGIEEQIFFELVGSLEKKRLVEFHEIYVSLTELGAELLIEEKYMKNKKSQIPQNFRNPYRVKVNSFYIPKKKLIF